MRTSSNIEEAAPDAAVAHFNPLVLLQSLLSADLVSIKQRIKAAQQLEEYFRLLPGTPGLLLSCEPYLPLLMDVMVSPLQGSQELQSSVIAMLQTLSTHNPTGFGDWIARNLHQGNEPWLVQWSYALLLQTEKMVPTDNDQRWEEASIEFKQFDRVFVQVMHMWRTLLDHTADVELVDQLVKYLQALYMQTDYEAWHTLMRKKMQVHFVDIADVLVGWMMSTGPESNLLREEILTVLHNFGQLWADNSVFSLQIINSFAEEIVTLCNSWAYDSRSNSDRLSTLLSCFLMVAQCVPCLALSNEEGAQSPFSQVLCCVVSAPQPEYSLFCLANCSGYLVSISNSRHTNFAPLSVKAIGFLLHHCAVQSYSHDGEFNKIAIVLSNACKLARENFSDLVNPLSLQGAATSLLDDDISFLTVNKDGQPKRLKIFECLFHFDYANTILYTTQLCLQLARLGGAAALKVLGTQALERLNLHSDERSNPYFVFTATCFILLSRDLADLKLADDDDTLHLIKILDLITSALDKRNQRQSEFNLRQLCLVMKMACGLIEAVLQRVNDHSDAAETLKRASLRILELATWLLPTKAMVLQDYQLSTETLQTIHALLSETKLIVIVPNNISQSILQKVTKVARCSSVRVREGCIQVLEDLNCRVEARAFAGIMFDVLLDLLLDPNISVQRRIITSTLNSVAQFALFSHMKMRIVHPKFRSLHLTFVSADFEDILSLFQSQNCDEKDWSLVCRRIMTRAIPDVALGNANILLGAIRQAAAWCVNNRLRTHFGGPAQSFASLERLVQEYSGEALCQTGWTLKNSEVTCFRSGKIPKLLLLEFVSELDMRMTRAIFATDVDQRNSESDECKSVLFFRTNKVVCDDWLNRIRPYLVVLSKQVGSSELNRHYRHASMTSCYTNLSRVVSSSGSSELSNNEVMQAESEFDAALFSLCQFHCNAKDADSIIGFQRWSISYTSALKKLDQLGVDNIDSQELYRKMPRYRWHSALRYEAEMRYEDAIKEYETLLEVVFNWENSRHASFEKIFENSMKFIRISPLTLLGCIKQCAKCYVAMQMWTKLRQFISIVVELTASFVKYDYPDKEIQAIFDWSNTWNNELEMIGTLETPVSLTANVTKLASDQTIRAAIALRDWDGINETNAGMTGDAFFDSSLAGQLWHEFIPLALQQITWNGYAGEKNDNRVEEIVLRLFGATNETQSSSQLKQFDSGLNGLRLNPEKHNSGTWGHFFCTHRVSSVDYSADKECLHLVEVARLARKQHNYHLAERLMERAAGLYNTNIVSATFWSYEKSKYLQKVGMLDDGRRLLEAQCEACLSFVESNQTNPEQESMIARSFLYLAKLNANAEIAGLLQPAAPQFFDTATAGSNEALSASDFASDLHDVSAYRYYHTALAISPQSAKAWAYYSHWCYDRGKSEIERVLKQNGCMNLNLEDTSKLMDLLHEMDFSEEHRDDIRRAFCQIQEDGEVISERLNRFRQLTIELAPRKHHSDVIDRLLHLLQTCHAKVFKFYELACRGYSKYLSLRFSDASTNFPRQEITVVMLRLLGLLTTYGSEKEVSSALEDVISTGPVAPWSYIIPQIIARAHHPSLKVSSLIYRILKRLAHQSPHELVYPAVVASMESEATFASIHKDNDASHDTFAAVLHELHHASPGQAEGVHIFISELRRISILWDEAWISTLVKLSADVFRRKSTLEKEAIRLEKNTSLSTKEKKQLANRVLGAIMKPIYVSLEKLWNDTCGCIRDQHLVTPHERKFLKDYGRVIGKALEKFHSCCIAEFSTVSLKDPQEIWQPFEDILKALLNSAGRREQLLLSDLSPAMASSPHLLALTNIPGAAASTVSGQIQPITIYRVNPFVSVLRTKTKPKSLELIGSDGNTYKYLLKAREDLRLDERIMQFLRVTNEFLQADNAAAARNLLAQSYSVIPLSNKAGLIQMVPDVVPLFQVYTARTDANGPINKVADAGSSAQQQISPPTAQFYAKLKQHGISNVSPSNRSRWSASVLRKVYQELVAQRPRNVLQQEILVRSDDLRQSWNKRIRLGKSLAVMSVLGYIIGLGDRHLDNILLCVKSGDIVHIDYNVCFDKGRRLKVPEIVPFRLTPMLQDALGFTGVEGNFRVAFETTLRIVRSDRVREALLMLFEAFIYSPLVEWINDDRRQERSGDLKARLEVKVNVSLFLSRAEERRQDTISFGRQYERSVDAIIKAIDDSAIPFLALLEQRELLLSLQREETMFMEELLSAKAELGLLQSAEHSKRIEADSAKAQQDEVTAKLTTFADECFARHRQIQVWKQRSISFAESNPAILLSTVTSAISTAVFQTCYGKVKNALTKLQLSGQEWQHSSLLESCCQSVDADVSRFCIEVKEVSNELNPYLLYYGRLRKELVAFFKFERKLGGKDVYYKWWNRCTEFLRAPIDTENQAKSSPTVTTSAPSVDDVAESKMVLSRLDESSDYHLSEAEETPSTSRADDILGEVATALSSMKLSNAQGQRLMKLAGASWILKVLMQLKETCALSIGTFTPALIAPPKFGFVVAITNACCSLLAFVSTPKGSMKRLRANELLTSFHDRIGKEGIWKSFIGLNDVFNEVGLFAVALQEEFVSNLYGRKIGISTHSVTHIKEILKNFDGREDSESYFPMSTSNDTNDLNLLIETELTDLPGVCKFLAAGFAFIAKISRLVSMLHQMSMMTGDEAKCMERSSSANWIKFMLNVVDTSAATGLDEMIMREQIRTMWSIQIDDFVSSCLLPLLQHQLYGLISIEWNFKFFALDEHTLQDEADLQSLSERWDEFCSSQILDILPSSPAASSIGALRAFSTDVFRSVATFMAVCTEWWACEWNKVQSKAWTQCIQTLKTRHAGRLRYAAWLADSKPPEDKATDFSRTQLLAFLSSQVPRLNALMADQAALKEKVSELVKQMEYLASNISDTSAVADADLHACIQNVYSKVTGLFEYAQTLSDLVQGVSVIETSNGDIQLEVDVVGHSLFQSASSAIKELHLRNEALNEAAICTQKFQVNLQQRQKMCDAVLLRKNAVENAFHLECLGYKDMVLEVAHVLRMEIKKTGIIFNQFDTLNPVSEHPYSNSVKTDHQRQEQTEVHDSLSEDCLAEFSLMENDRLAQLLLRSIRSVDNLLPLEKVLEDHGEVCTSLRATLSQLDKVLSNFTTQADQLLDTDAAGHQSRLCMLLLLDLIKALRVVKTEDSSQAKTSLTNLNDNASMPPLVVARDLLRECVKLFFKATEMADRLTYSKENELREVAFMPDELDTVEAESNEDVATLEPDKSDTGISCDTTATAYQHPEKNQYGLHVLKRIEEKISGVVAEKADTQVILTVEQQASWLIDEATKPDNLCVMYEGWTPWI